MPKIDRNSIEDAIKVTTKLLPNQITRNVILEFLKKAILFADQLNSQNWNLNLDKNGQFIRFNVGHEYCIRIRKNNILVICQKDSLKKSLGNKNLEIDFLGRIKREEIISKNIDDVPNCLAKVPNSVGCYMSHDNVREYLPILEKSNLLFLEYAISNTKQRPVMREAHSKGFMSYLEILGLLNDFDYSEEESNEFHSTEEIPKQQAKELLEGQKKTITVNVHERDRNARKQCLEHWKTNCVVCKFSFEENYGNIGKGFIHVHHLKPLSEIKKEYKVNPIEDLRPVCPNCHAMLHTKNPPYSIEELRGIVNNYKNNPCF
jgi:5-methylcytosine-specific restriction protein A